MAEVFSPIYGYKKDFYSPCGNDEAIDFGYVKKEVNGKDEIVFEQVGTHSINDYINSFNDTTDIKKIFERYMVGDVSVLTKRVGDYMDTVGIPDNLLDAKLMIQNGEKAFSELPPTIKEQYGNDPMKFIQACQDGSISKVIKGLDQQHEIDQNIKNVGYQIQDDQAKQIKELQAQIEELKGVKYE